MCVSYDARAVNMYTYNSIICILALFRKKKTVEIMLTLNTTVILTPIPWEISRKVLGNQGVMRRYMVWTIDNCIEAGPSHKHYVPGIGTVYNINVYKTAQCFLSSYGGTNVPCTSRLLVEPAAAIRLACLRV